MEGTLGPEDVRSRQFEMVRRGYDKRQVDRFRDEVAVGIAALTTELEGLRAKLGQAGMDDIPDLKTELNAVSTEVAGILEAARSAAEGMRSRASEDAARWRAEADRESRSLRSTSAKDAEQVRRAAWEEGTELLRQADDEARAVVEQARQDALFIRAEAEREALRLTGDARRDREEALRKARSDSERLLMEARAESERILAKARQSAESAQERAQALEQRRTELMQELEAARLSIGQLEQEIDTRREALHAAAEAPDSGVRVIKNSGDSRSDWVDDDASVRVVPASRVAPDEPVDPDAFVAEVEQLQSQLASAAEAVDAGRAALSEAGADMAPPPVGEAERAEPVAVEEPAAAAGDDAATSEPSEEPADEPDDADDDTGNAAEPAAAPAPEPPPPPSAVPEGIEDLFARLRTGDAAATPPAGEAAPSDVLPEADESPEAAAEPAAGEPTAPARTPREAAAAAEEATARHVAADPFELRDRVLLPIENRTLRSIKRRIVDLQNRVLEELRVGGDDWEPDRSMFVAAVAEDIGRLNQESFVGGHAAAAELVGEAAAPPPDRAADQSTSADFVNAFMGAVVESIKRARGSGGGSRQVSAAVGRVFRAWRTDEAERRLRHAGYSAYHEGLLGAYPGLGVTRVVAVAPGAPCGDCPAGTGASWDPSGSPPPGTAVPPAGPECRATILPAS